MISSKTLSSRVLLTPNIHRLLGSSNTHPSRVLLTPNNHRLLGSSNTHPSPVLLSHLYQRMRIRLNPRPKSKRPMRVFSFWPFSFQAFQAHQEIVLGWVKCTKKGIVCQGGFGTRSSVCFGGISTGFWEIFEAEVDSQRFGGRR